MRGRFLSKTFWQERLVVSAASCNPKAAFVCRGSNQNALTCIRCPSFGWGFTLVMYSIQEVFCLVFFFASVDIGQVMQVLQKEQSSSDHGLHCSK